MASYTRPEFDEYFMRIALAVRDRADCVGRKVGAVVAIGEPLRLVAAGYNGTPKGMKNCSSGGCARCKNREVANAGVGYDVCVCVHGEENAILSAAKQGIRLEGARLYTTMSPCFICLREAISCGIEKIRYLHDWKPRADKSLESQYARLKREIDIAQVPVDDDKADWAMGRLGEPPRIAEAGRRRRGA